MQEKKFDLSLGNLGPYNKEFLGVCHVADPRRGATFHVEAFPGFFRRRFLVASTLTDDGVKMWGANATLTHFTYRYELAWKDQLFCDVDYAISGDRRCDITCTFVNNTRTEQSVNLNLCASLQRPQIFKHKAFRKYKTFCYPILPEGCHFRDAVEHDDISSDMAIASDGKYLCEVEWDFATGLGTAIYGPCFTKEDHHLLYRFEGVKASALGIRLSTQKEDAALRVVINGKNTYSLALSASEGFTYYTLPIAATEVNTVALYPASTDAIIDALTLGDKAAAVVFKDESNSTEPMERTEEEDKITLRYEGVDHTYTLFWDRPLLRTRRYHTNDLELFLRRSMHNHVSFELSDGGVRTYENFLTNPFVLAPGESQSLTFTLLVDGGAEKKEPAPLYTVSGNADGEKYLFSQNMMAYNAFLNVVYPIYTRRQYIRHNTPGRNWDCLYTWDSGFIGMGLATADFTRAYECLNTYLTPVGDRHSPFIFHGSVVPTQIFLYKYLFDRFPEHREDMRALFPMVMQYYRFYSTLSEEEHQMKSGMLKTWHIDCNSGGWDDYPPQHFIQTNTEKDISPSYHDTTPVITTSNAILISKILKNIAITFGEPTEEFDVCVARLSAAIQSGPWDEEVGYFSYITHDKEGNPTGFLRAADGSNYNQGFDGIYPYIAGVTTDAQSAAIMDNIKNGLLTDVGVGVVDTRASYYSPMGYWNGTVWMPHQWILTRALLDNGEGDLSYKIADIALNVWQTEVDATYSCFEHFMRNGRGAGFHQFSGLSTPVLMFFESYYKPGTLTVGFMTSVTAQEWSEDGTALTATLAVGGKHPVALVCLREGQEYTFTVNGKAVAAKKRTAGAYEIPLTEGVVTLTVKKA